MIKDNENSYYLGSVIVFFHIILYYAVPYIYFLYFPNEQITTYYRNKLDFYGYTYLFISFLAPLLLIPIIKLNIFNKIRWPEIISQLLRAFWSSYGTIRIILSLLFVVSSFKFFSDGFNYYRYSNTTISEFNSIYLHMVILLKSWTVADLLFFLFSQENSIKERHPYKWKISSFFIITSWTISIDGSASAIYASVLIYVLIFPSVFKNHLMCSPLRGFENTFIIRSIRHGGAIILFLILALLSWHLGNAVKEASGQSITVVEGSSTKLKNENLGEALSFGLALSEAASPLKAVEKISHAVWRRIKWLPERIGTGLYSYTVIHSKIENGQYDVSQAWNVIASAFWHRSSILFGIDNDTQITHKTIAQMNYRNIEPEEYQNNRSGASPGLLASFSYILERPYDIIGAISYIFIIVLLIDRASVGNKKKISLFGMLLICFIFQIFLINPSDYLLIIDGGFVSFAVFVLIVEANFASYTRLKGAS